MKNAKLAIFTLLLAVMFVSSTAYGQAGKIDASQQLIVTPESNAGRSGITPEQEEVPLVIKILNYNIWETGKLDEWLDVIREENADIIMAIETGNWQGSSDEDFLETLSTINGFFPDETPYEGRATSNNPSVTAGEAIFSRFPIKSFATVANLVLDDSSTKGAHNPLMDAVVEIRGTDVHIIGVHHKCCASAAYELEREQDQEGINNYMDDLGDVPIIYGGDMNSFSSYDIEVLNVGDTNLGTGPSDMLLDPTNPKTTSVHTWIDGYRELNPYEPGYTYVDEFYKSRIDMLYFNAFFEEMLVNSTAAHTASAKIGSDHYPMDVTINWDYGTVDLRPPVQVYGMNATILSSTELNITWCPNPETDLAYYMVYIDGAAAATPTDAFYHDIHAIPSQIHRYHVCAVDISDNVGVFSSLLAVNTSRGVCTEPDAPVVSSTSGDGMLEIQWTLADNGGLPVLFWRICRYLDVEDVWRLWANVTGASTSYTETGLTNGKTLVYAMSAVNEIGEGPRSDSMTIEPKGAPNPPALLSFEVNEECVDLNWPAPYSDGGYPVTSYRVYRSSESGKDYSLLDEISVLEYSDENVEKSETYYYVITAVNLAGESGYSPEAMVEVGGGFLPWDWTQTLLTFSLIGAASMVLRRTRHS